MTRRIEHAPAPIWRLILEGRSATLMVTGNHRILCRSGWSRIDELGERDEILGAMGPRRIASVAPQGRLEVVYNLYTARLHNFLAGDVIAHNFSFLPHLRTLIHRLVFDRLVLRRLARFEKLVWTC